jgi:hypothetical protein
MMKITYLFEYILIFAIFSKGLIFIIRILVPEFIPLIAEKLTILTITAGVVYRFFPADLKVFFFLFTPLLIKILLTFFIRSKITFYNAVQLYSINFKLLYIN